jgi:hypothetical protein
MSESYNINSILLAVEDLNNKNKKLVNKPRLLTRDDVPPQADKIIREAEEFKKENIENSNFKNDKNLEIDKKIEEMEVAFNKKISELKTKLEYQTIIYKENYDRLLIENNDIKQRLANAKNHINSFQEVKLDIVSTISNLNQIITKSEIIGQIKPKNFSTTNDAEKLNLKNKEIKD